MADSHPAPHNLKHVRIDGRRKVGDYSAPNRDMSEAIKVQDHKTNGPRLTQAFTEAFTAARAGLVLRETASAAGKAGLYVEVEARAGEGLPDLSWVQKDIRMGAVKVNDKGVEVGAVFVPLASTDYLLTKVAEYTNTPPDQKARHRSKMDPLETIRPGAISSLWTDQRPLPVVDETLWWECWCWKDRVANMLKAARGLKLRVSERRLKFPDYVVVPVYGSRADIQRLLQNCDAIEELRRAEDSPHVFHTVFRRDQSAWSDDLVGRVVAPAANAPTVCVLDGGVAYDHPLLATVLTLNECHAVDAAWLVDDTSPLGHGTGMAGVALYGDLTYPIASSAPIDLAHGLESVKILPPPGFPKTEPENYGSITQSAISLTEIAAPAVGRVFCMAVTNFDVSGERPTSWSAAVDQICAGIMPGDAVAGAQRRLFVISAGNIQDESDPDLISDADEFPIEDPAQAWNALSVGGFTDKVDIKDGGYDGWTVAAGVGDVSPFSRNSVDWSHSVTPIKPEVVFEAGNRALNAAGTEIVAGLDSLSLLTTAREFDQLPLTTIWATSPATAQAASFAATIMADQPDLWPETVRALMVHSAQWTPRMLERLKSCKTKGACIKEARQFGYGVPQLERALSSARNDVALIAQGELQPFKRERKVDKDGRNVLQAPTLNVAHYYDLPWPKAALEALDKNVQLKVVLSYFVEPSPGDLAPVTPSRYQSFGLRYDLKRPTESTPDFVRRFNQSERVKDVVRPKAETDNRWKFGTQSIAAGSLHCDVWEGPAVDLAARNVIAVYPVAGWWKNRTSLGQWDRKARYALVVSITSDDATVDLHAAIQIANQTPVQLQIG
ncbi:MULTISPECIES: S8 family peptidase [unclassified Brevundimonas]